MPKLFKLLLLGTVLAATVSAQTVYTRSRRGFGSGLGKPSAYKGVAGSFHGKLKELTDREIMIETGENQTVSIHRSRKTKFLKGKEPIKASDIDLETLVTVDASEEPDLTLTAVSVIVDAPQKTTDAK